MAQANVQPKAPTKTADRTSTASLLRLAGYGMLLLGLFDVIAAFVPSNFQEPAWEFQLVGNLVERSVVPLVGLALAFYGEREGRGRFERPLLPLLSWGALIGGIAYLALIPLGVTTAVKINAGNERQISTQVSQRLGSLQQIKDQLSTATPATMTATFNQLKKANRLPPEIRTPDQLKKKMEENLANLESQLGTQSEKTQGSVRTNLLRNSTKWNLGALVSGVFYILVWRQSRWARRRP
jgi:hypothetical protein